MNSRIKIIINVLTLLGLITAIGCSPADDDDSDKVHGSSFWKGHINVVTVSGSPYEMGYAQGVLLKDEILDILESYIGVLIPMQVIDYVVEKGLVETIERDLHPEHLTEIRGMYDGIGASVPWPTFLMINVPLYIIYNYIYTLMPPSNADVEFCSSFIAYGDATADGKLIHGRNLDWPDMLFPEKYPTVIVFKPNEGNSFASLTFPGQVGVLSGINDKGLTASVHVAISIENEFKGEPILMTIRRVLQYASNVEQAEKIISEADHPHGANIVVSYGGGGGLVAELSASRQMMRKPTDDSTLRATNHYEDPELHKLSAGGYDNETSYLRYARIGQLLDEYYGEIDPEIGVRIMTDHTHPDTGEVLDPFESEITIAKYNNMYSIIFRPETGDFWLSSGSVPANAMQDFIGFNLFKLLGDKSFSDPEDIINPIAH